MKISQDRDPITFISDLKDRVERRVLNISQVMLPRTIDYEILRFQMIVDYGEHQIGHVLKFFLNYL